MSYVTISSQENHHFSLCSYFHAHPTTLLLKILGETNAWAVPPPQIWGWRPPVFPLGLRPCYSAPSSPLLHCRGAPDYSTDTVSEFHAEAHRQLQVKDLPKVP